MIPARDALAALLLLALLAGALLLVAERPGPGPLPLCTGLACVHAALLAPSFTRGAPAWGLLPVALALPALAATAYGRGGSGAFLSSVLLVALAAAAGTAGRALGERGAGRLYLPSMILLFAAPFALRYLRLELVSPAAATGWGALSPWGAAEAVAAGAALPAPCALLLALWPVVALARRGR